MLFFIQNLFSYLMLEVIETEWNKFVKNIKEVESLEEMIWKHREFVDNIMRGSMNYHDNPMKNELKNLLSMIVNFKHTQDLIFTTL
jgi:hypothetical protein